jgi:catechol 2,3-dioxygenase-like lactoylglutathione lyase family enzyme
MVEWYARPVLHVADVQRAVDFYVDKLGFAESWGFDQDGAVFVAQVERDGCAIIFSSQWPEKVGKGLLFVSLGDGSLAVMDAARAELEGRGAPVRDGQWGYRLFVVDDPDGNQLFFNYPNDDGA